MPSEILLERIKPGGSAKITMRGMSQDTTTPTPAADSSFAPYDTTKELIVPLIRGSWDGVERRQQGSCRRQVSDRRTTPERRKDTRIDCSSKRSVKARIRSIIGGRLGVDRRKGCDRRVAERRSTSIRSLVTPEELDALLRL
jgi:hypothetical protein